MLASIGSLVRTVVSLGLAGTVAVATLNTVVKNSAQSSMASPLFAGAAQDPMKLQSFSPSSGSILDTLSTTAQSLEKNSAFNNMTSTTSPVQTAFATTASGNMQWSQPLKFEGAPGQGFAVNTNALADAVPSMDIQTLNSTLNSLSNLNLQNVANGAAINLNALSSIIPSNLQNGNTTAAVNSLNTITGPGGMQELTRVISAVEHAMLDIGGTIKPKVVELFNTVKNSR